MMRTSYTRWLILPFLLSAVRVASQIERPFKELKLDSLEKAVAMHRKNDEAKLSLLNLLSSVYANVNFDKGIETGNQAIALAQKLKKPLLLAEAYHYTAQNLSAKSEFEKAMELSDKALAINQNQNNKYGIALNNLCTGDIFRRKGNHKKALEHFEKSLPPRRVGGHPR